MKINYTVTRKVDLRSFFREWNEWKYKELNFSLPYFFYTDVRVFLYRLEKKYIYLEAERLVMVIAIKDVRHSLLLERLKLFGALKNVNKRWYIIWFKM